MSSFESDSAAAEALAAANQSDVAASERPSEQAPAPNGNESTQVDGTNQASESFTNIDVDSLPDQLRDAYRNMQGDYTRKTQEIAPIRQIMSETGMSADEARQALDFVQSLQNDPDAVRNLYEHLSQEFTPEQDVNEYDYSDEGSVDPRDQQINDLSSRLERFERAQAMTEARAQLESAVNAVRSSHPDYEDADIERIQRIAVSYMQGGADINRAMQSAAQEFSGWRDQMLASYLEGKSAAQTKGSPLAPTGHAETMPGTFKDLDEATKAALARLGTEWAN